MFFVAGGQRHDQLREAGDFVHLLFDGEAGLQILELDVAAGLGKDREGERIPFGENLADGDRLALFDADASAVYDVVALRLASFFIEERDQAGTVHGDDGVVAAMHDLEVQELDEAGAAGLDLGLLLNPGGGAADVEGAHGELGAGLADGLGTDDAHGLAELNRVAAGQVAGCSSGRATPRSRR